MSSRYRKGLGGHFLNQPETRAYLRHDHIPVWPPVGADMLEIARTEAGELLTTHQPPPLPSGAQAEVNKIMSRAEKVLA
jgi:hypothetical protein